MDIKNNLRILLAGEMQKWAACSGDSFRPIEISSFYSILNLIGAGVNAS
jgi:hypothetical protein